MSKQSKAAFDKIGEAVALIKQTQEPVLRVLFPHRYDLENATPLLAAEVMCSSLPVEDQHKLTVFNPDNHYANEPLSSSFSHHHGNASIWYYEIYTDEIGYPKDRTIEKDALRRAFMINEHLAHKDNDNDNLQYLPSMHNIVNYHCLGLIMEEAKKTGELERIKDIFSAHQASLLNFVKEELKLVDLVVKENKKNKPLLAPKVAEYSKTFIPKP